MTFQNIFSSMADFRDVVSVLLHAARLIKARKIFVADWPWAIVSWYARNINTAATLANWLAPKKGRTFQFNLFLWVICVYYIPHNYVIPQTMPHDIPQTHSSCHPYRLSRAFQEVFPPQMPCCFIRIHARLGTAVKTSQPFHDTHSANVSPLV